MRIALILSVLCLASCAPGKWETVETNDFFTPLNKDKHYTQGLSVSHTDLAGNTLEGEHHIYTPGDKRLEQPLLTDRPYNATLSGSLLSPVSESIRVGARLGVMGAGALGEEIQCGVHKILGQYCPYGWDTVAPTSGIVDLLAEWQTQDQPVDLFGATGLSRYTVAISAGTYRTALDLSSRTEWQAWKIYYFAGPALSIVARDSTLDGPILTSAGRSHRVQSELLVPRMEGGLGFYINTLKIEWFLAVLGKEWSTSEGTYHYGGLRFIYTKDQK
jgi:hypothetical protein